MSTDYNSKGIYTYVVRTHNKNVKIEDSCITKYVRLISPLLREKS